MKSEEDLGTRVSALKVDPELLAAEMLEYIVAFDAPGFGDGIDKFCEELRCFPEHVLTGLAKCCVRHINNAAANSKGAQAPSPTSPLPNALD